MILEEKKNSAKFGEKWPKIWPTCIFRPGKSLDGLKSDFGGEKKIRPNLMENGRKCGQHASLGLGRDWEAYKLILEGKKNSAKFGGKWPKIWTTCIFRPEKSLDIN